VCLEFEARKAPRSFVAGADRLVHEAVRVDRAHAPFL